MTTAEDTLAATYPAAPWRLWGEAWVGLWRVECPASLPSGLTPLLGRRWLVVALARYRGGTLRYHEVLVGRLARQGVRPGLLVEGIWVDHPASRAGGREIWGLPKEMAAFDWRGDTVRVTTTDGPLVTLRVGRPELRLPWLPLLAPAFGRRDGNWLYLVGRPWARLGRGGFWVVEWSERLPARPAGQPMLSLAAWPLRLTVPPPLRL